MKVLGKIRTTVLAATLMAAAVPSLSTSAGLCLWLRLSVQWLWLWLQQLWLCPGLLRQLRLRPPVLCLWRTVLSPPLGPSAAPSLRVLALAITRSGPSAG
jgi:hypothetical protein